MSPLFLYVFGLGLQPPTAWWTTGRSGATAASCAAGASSSAPSGSSWNRATEARAAAARSRRPTATAPSARWSERTAAKHCVVSERSNAVLG